jgi:predicted RNase H-like HicB family nuclease
MKTAYTAELTPKENRSGYLVRVPDLPGCVTSGDTVPDAIAQIRDAMGVYLLSLEDEGQPFPSARLPEGTPSQPGALYALVDVDTLEYRKATDTAAVRKNVTIPSWMAYRADKLNINVSNVLQNALEAQFRQQEQGKSA